MDENLSSKRYEPPAIDLNNRNSSHTLTIEMTGSQKKVLEIGTSTGFISRILRERGNTVTGVEIDAEAAGIARQFCDRMIVGDIETLELSTLFEPGSFDVIIFGDVLEHLKRPALLLERVQPYLRDDGYLIVSLPNFCHGDVLLDIMTGDFQSQPLGLLDETHLQVFGLKKIYSLFARCGYQISELHRTTLEIGETELKIDLQKIPPALLKFIRALPDSTSYQFVFSALPSRQVTLPAFRTNDLSTIFEGSIEESLQPLKDEWTWKISAKDQQVHNLEDHIGMLQEMIKGKDVDRQKADEYAKSLEQQISAKEQQIQDLVERIQSMEQATAERTEHLHHLETEAAERTRHIQNLEQAAADKGEYIHNLENHIQMLLQMIRDKEDDHHKVDEYALSLQQMIAEKDLHSHNQESYIQSLLDIISEKEKQHAKAILAKKNQIRRMTCRIKSLEKQLSCRVQP